MNVLKTHLVKIGNSQGLRIPKVILDQLDLQDEIEMEVQRDCLIIRPLHPPRHDWSQQFQAMAASGDDVLLDDAAPGLTTWDDEEWEW